MKSFAAILVGPIQYIEIPLGTAFFFDDFRNVLIEGIILNNRAVIVDKESSQNDFFGSHIERPNVIPSNLKSETRDNRMLDPVFILRSHSFSLFYGLDRFVFWGRSNEWKFWWFLSRFCESEIENAFVDIKYLALHGGVREKVIPHFPMSLWGKFHITDCPPIRVFVLYIVRW